VLLSFLLAGTIAEPIRRLARAAERVRLGSQTRVEIPDFTKRSDEIGHLSSALRDMTTALYNRIDAIESFAADVAHELKNPLTSLRSAVETLPLAKDEKSRQRLVAIVQDDVKRLDRLISDISDASRLDAELARADTAPVNIAELLDTLVSVFNETRRWGDPRFVLSVDAGGPRGGGLVVNGHDSRLGQVVRNLIANARSFSPQNGEIWIYARRVGPEVEIKVEDEGPGIRPENLTKIFDRFHTDRPGAEQFGKNSGLGLSISKQIVEAHAGRIWAENRHGDKDKHLPESRRHVLGARFIVRLPATFGASARPSQSDHAGARSAPRRPALSDRLMGRLGSLAAGIRRAATGRDVDGPTRR
jgi:two-component system sensor histidine kinase ChvG